MNDMRPVTAGSIPLSGDVVVTPDSSSAARCGVRQVPGTVQFSASPQQAVRLARSFARKHAVNVWYTENGVDTLLEVCRARIANRARVRE